jgi:anti-anti-sigma factor
LKIKFNQLTNMNFKMDTKEKFTEITIFEPHLSANMTAELEELLIPILENPVKNVVLNLYEVTKLDEAAASKITSIQNQFYENSSSFVMCGIQPAVEQALDSSGLLQEMNITPTISEAWDIVQMEEIERELLDGF